MNRTCTHFFLILSFLLACGTAAADQLGPDPTLVFEGHLGYSTNADTLLNCAGSPCGDNGLGLGGSGENCEGLNGSTIQINDVPESDTLRLVHARLNWAASTPVRDMPDMTVTLTAPGGEPIGVLADPDLSESFQDGLANCEAQIPFLCPEAPGGLACSLGFYSNHADVTQIISAHMQGGGSLNGDWSIADVDIPGANGNDPQTAIAAIGSLTIGAWSVVLVYEDRENLGSKKIYYYQGFELNEGLNRRLFPSGFDAPPDPEIDLTIMVLEGDEGIAGDQLNVNGRQVSDACNPANNVFNSTVNTGGECRRGVQGVDLDRYAIARAIDAGDDEAEVELVIPRGDGFVTPGEQLFTNWMILAFDHLLPDFESFKPEKEAVPPNGTIVRPGDIISYRIRIANDGSVAATNVVLTDGVPLFTNYMPGSAILDGNAFRDDPGGRSPVENGLELTGLDAIGDSIEVGESHFFQFNVRVAEDAPNGYRISNVASIVADLIDPQETDPVSHPVESDNEPGEDQGVEPPPNDMGVAGDMGGQQADMAELLPLDFGTDEDAAADMSPEDICGPGTRLDEDGLCQSICGAGLRWDPSCEPAQCVQTTQPPCAGEAPANQDGCDCSVNSSQPLSWLLLLGVLGLFRRKRH